MELISRKKEIKKGDIFKLFDYFNSFNSSIGTPALTVFIQENTSIFDELVKEIQKEFKYLSKEESLLVKEYEDKENSLLKKYIKLDSKGMPITDNNKYVFKSQIAFNDYTSNHKKLKEENKEILKVVEDHNNYRNNILEQNIVISLWVLPFESLPQINMPFFVIKLISDYIPIIKKETVEDD